MVKDAAIHCLKRGLRGRLIEPGDADYETARQVYNGMIDRYPAPHRALRGCRRCHRRGALRPRARAARSPSGAAATTARASAPATTGW